MNQAGFSLLELLVVVGLVAVLSVAIVRQASGGSTVALESAQALVANLLSTAQARALAGGGNTRLLVNQGSAGPASARYLRYLVVQEQAAEGGAWTTFADAFLPDGVCVVPESSHTPGGLMAEPGEWTKTDGGVLDSSILSVLAEPTAVGSYPADIWSVIGFSSAGAPSPAGGCLVLALARTLSPGHELPVQLVNPSAVRGVMLSRYGVPVLLNAQNEF